MTKEIENKGQKMFILAGVLLAMFLASMDSTIVGTAMPQVIKSLNGMEHYSWPFTIYILCTAVVMPIAGKLADTFGFKLLFFIGIGLFLGCSALCGTSESMMQLILFRNGHVGPSILQTAWYNGFFRCFRYNTDNFHECRNT